MDTFEEMQQEGLPAADVDEPWQEFVPDDIGFEATYDNRCDALISSIQSVGGCEDFYLPSNYTRNMSLADLFQLFLQYMHLIKHIVSVTRHEGGMISLFQIIDVINF